MKLSVGVKYLPRICGLILLFVGIAFLVHRVFATFSLGIDGIEPTSVSSKEQSVVVRLSVSDLPSESYFRVAWQESDGKPYFGYMQNNAGDWVQIQSLSSDCKKYYKVTNLATNSASIVVKIGEDQDILSGPYLLKAHRFTASCSYSSMTPSTTITVVLPTPTPTVTATPTPAPTSTPTPTPEPTVTPTRTPTSNPTPTKTPTPTLKPTPTLVPTASESAALSSASAAVLGATDSPATASVQADRETKPSVKPLIISLLFVGIGCAILSLVFVWKKRDAILKE